MTNKERCRLWYINNKEKHRANDERWRKNNPTRHKANAWKSQLKHKFGLSVEQYEVMKIAQNNSCAICHQVEIALEFGGTRRRLSVDHCHKTGKLRKLLCIKCNSIIGLANDKIEVLKSAINYLEKHKT